MNQQKVPFIERLLSDLRAEFTARLEAKTSWGRNDVRAEFDQTMVIVLSRMLSSACEYGYMEEDDEDVPPLKVPPPTSDDDIPF